MIVGEELKAWLSNREAHRRVEAAASRAADAWSDGRAHRRFDQVLGPVRDAGVNEIVEAAHTLFADDAWVDALIDHLAQEMRADPYFEPPFRALNSDIHSGLLVFEDQHVNIAAGVSRVAQLAAKKNVKGKAASVNFTGQVSVLKFVKAGGAAIAFWEGPEIGEGFSAATAGTCRRTKRRVIADGEILVVDGRRQSYVIEHATSNLVVLQANLRTGQAPVAVEYDAASGAYLGCSATDDGASRIQMISTLVRKLGHEQAFEAIAAFLDHPSFFVRWHVMRELVGIDAAAALPHLKRMAARDPHPDPRAAARLVLDHVESAIPRKDAA
ncbi:MAG: HEAT repeat domain-containing protein [Sphingosinicella sp.]|uniref:HEAT repeat domain-containing protein n=1 Tax=Sphingosinicella sp. TaxID=1917971 RepID=UPI0040384475